MQQTAGMGLVISGPEIRVCRAPPEGGEQSKKELNGKEIKPHACRQAGEGREHKG